MATKKRVMDPAQAANEQVLERRQERIDARMREVPDLGLGLESKAETPAEFLRDAWDKAAFGDEPKTITRWVYGPDPLIDQCPEFKKAIEEHGLQAYAEATARAIVLFEEKAVPDPVMRRGLFAAIKKFGKEQVAEAFAKRILGIPARQVEYETDNGAFGDPELLGSNALRDCVRKFGNEPGMTYKFLSPRCIDVLGLRGYELVLDHKGNQVKAGTLLMGRIPLHIAEGRRRRYVQDSEEQVASMEQAYMESQERLVRAAGKIGAGSRPLGPGDTVSANATESQEFFGQERAGGFSIEREK